MIAYFNNRYLPKEEVRVSPDDRGFLFGDGVYEVIRSYNGKLFHIDAHLERLERSLRELRITGVDVASFQHIAATLLERNDLRSSDGTVYMQVTRGAAPRKHSFPDHETYPTVYLSASPLQPPFQKMENGIKVILTPDLRWARCDIKSVALVANVLASQQATEQGAEEAIFVRDGAIIEGSHSSFCAVFDGTLVTHPLCNYILDGITRRVVLNLCRELGIPVKESPTLEPDLQHADELMTLSTTAEVMPVVRVDDWLVGDGKPGPVTRRLQKAFREAAQP